MRYALGSAQASGRVRSAAVCGPGDEAGWRTRAAGRGTHRGDDPARNAVVDIQTDPATKVREVTRSGALGALAVLALGCAGDPAERSQDPTMATADEETAMMQLRTMGDGPPAVLVGGGLTGWLSWVPHQERLAATRAVSRAQPLAVRLGLENRPVPGGYSVEMESGALAAAVDERHPGSPVDLVGWSYGGLVALDYALRHSDRIRTLTLIEPPGFWVLAAAGDPAYAAEAERLRPFAERVRDEVTEADLVEFVEFASLVPPGVRPQTLPQWPVWLEHRRSLRGQFDAELEYRGDLERLRAFDRPVLLVKGRGSTPVLHRIVDLLAEAIPDARTLEFEGGHAPHIVEMEPFLMALERFHADAAR